MKCLQVHISGNNLESGARSRKAWPVLDFALLLALVLLKCKSPGGDGNRWTIRLRSKVVSS